MNKNEYIDCCCVDVCVDQRVCLGSVSYSGCGA